MRMTHDELAASLVSHIMGSQDAPMVWLDMQLGPVGSPRPDVYVIPKTYTALRPVIYEVKASVSDFRTDVTSGKWQSYRPMCSGIYFAFPADLPISKEDVPAECGIIRYHEDSGRWRAARKPVLRPVDNLPVTTWQKLLIDGVKRAQAQWNAERASEYSITRRVRKSMGDEVANFLSDAHAARVNLEAVKAGTHHELALARAKADSAVKEAREAARRELHYERQAFDLAVASMCNALGIPPGSPPDVVAARMRSSLSVIIGDMPGLARARTQLQAANDALAAVESLVAGLSQSQGERHA